MQILTRKYTLHVYINKGGISPLKILYPLGKNPFILKKNQSKIPKNPLYSEGLVYSCTSEVPIDVTDLGRLAEFIVY